MSSDNKTKFMEESSAHITNMNRVLKNIKSKVIANFIWSNQAGIIIINKVTLPLDFQTIEKYVKNANYIETDKVKATYLP